MSAQKIKFRVVYATGSDDEYSCSTLESHGPSVKGWRSERFCVYPQELIFQMPSRTRVRKLQILAHQYLIPRKVELFIGNVKAGGSFHSANFTRLGYISFDSNEKTSFKARELKSVHLDCEGTLFKIQCQKNHVNKLNIFNQVGLVAVNIIGDFVSERSDLPLTFKDLAGVDNSLDPGILGEINKPYTTNLVDDITFGMFQDPEIANIIQQLEKRKLEAIDEEQYDYAKRLKQAIGDLQRVGEKLGKLEQEKRVAVAEENYDLAQSKKVQANEIRAVVLEKLKIGQLLGRDDMPRHPSPPRHPDPRSDSTISMRARTESRSSDGMPTHGPIVVDERPIPTLSNKEAKVLPEDEAAPPGADFDGPDELSLKQARDLSAAVEAFGLESVACLFCKQFALRERGLNKIAADLKSNEVSGGIAPRAIIQVFKQAFSDPVFNTLALTLDTFKSAVGLDTFSMTQVEDICQATMGVLLKRAGDAPRIKSAISELFSELMDLPKMSDSKVFHSISVMPCKEKNPKVRAGRLKLIARLLEKVGADEGTSYSVEMVMKFVAPELSHTSRDVRDEAIKITLLMYKEVGDPVRDFLPKDEPELRKKQLIWKKIFEGFDKIDGKPVNAPPPLSQDEQKAMQVKALKAELAKLREMAANQNAPDDKKAPAEKQKKKKTKDEVPEPSPRAASAEGEDQLDRTCMFCNEHNDDFNAETLDVHFWKACPMLRRCGICSQVIEISGTTTHLLTECDAQDKFTSCDTCKLAKPVAGPHSCSGEPKPNEALCPLCFEVVEDGDEAWRSHLMQPSGCSKNPRRVK